VSQENVEAVRNAYVAFNEGDLETVRALFAQTSNGTPRTCSSISREPTEDGASGRRSSSVI
jgi:hypothetical protein